MNTSWDNEKLTIELEGRIDSGNAAAVESEISDALKDHTASAVILDAEDLEYISSAGLRSLKILYMKMRNKGGNLTVTNLAPYVAEVLEMTGFSEMLNIK